MMHDIVIVGAGLAGLTCGIALQKKGKKTCILEKYGYTGGRVVTYKKDGYQWENGAGRIGANHTHVHVLLKKYGLHEIPIGNDQLFIPDGSTEDDAIPNHFEAQLASILKQLEGLPSQLLATHTLEQLLKSILGESETIRFLHQFAYRAEVSVMRADHAMKSFLGEGEMGTYEGYTVCAEGLSALSDAMVKEYESLGGEILLRHEMIALEESDSVKVKCKVGSKKEGFHEEIVEGKKCILALHSAALKECSSTRHFEVLKHLVMCPLLRTYGVFPASRGKSWFSGLPKVVTGNPVRYFIPIDPSKGIAMVSYTDADDASRMMQILDSKGEKALGAFILRELRNLFPSRSIPDYVFFKSHPWTYGCTYWTPGAYSVEEMSRDCMHPDPSRFPSVYLCGESFSLRQAWMEGAIEHAESLLKQYF
jgi:monoamine oxidase